MTKQAVPDLKLLHFCRQTI